MSANGIRTITPAELARLQQESAALHLIDVRESDEFAELSAPFAVNMPLSALDPAAVAARCGRSAAIYLICRSGRRSLAAAKALAAAGFQAPVNVEGGMLAWAELGLPTVRA